MKTRLLLGVMALLLVACGSGEDRVTIGAKNFSESRILAAMMVELAKDSGISDVAIINYETSQAIQEALTQGDIDAYPEYNGTGLVMLGQNPIADGDAAMARVKELYEPLGMTWLPRLGFANNYALVMRPERAAELNVAGISDLVGPGADLTLGTEDDFPKRPLDGLQPLQARYGLTFGATVTVALDERATLYDRLLDGEVDVIEAYLTDGEIADYGLIVLDDDLQFFPVYEAAILARAASLSKHKALGAALEQLAGKIDNATMRNLNGKVDLEGRSPQAVARDALARMNLIDGGAVETEAPLSIATSPFLQSGATANEAVRAARRAFSGRDIQIVATHAPLQLITSSKARIALVGADELFDLTTTPPQRNNAFEALGALGQNLVHVITRADGPDNLANIETLATGPAGSSSGQLADALSTGLSLSWQMLPTEAENAAALIRQVTDGNADAALLSVPEGDSELLAAFTEKPLALIAINGWNDGNNLIRYPFLRQSRVSADTYPGQADAVETLGVQLVLAGPAADPTEVVGDQGPSSIAVGLSPVSPEAVLALNKAMPAATLLDPTLKQASALAPKLPTPAASINPAADISILNFFVIALFIWLVWLYARPEYT